MSTLAGTSDAQCEPESSGDTCEATDDPVRTLGKGSQDPEFQKEYPKLIGEDPIPVMPMRWKNASWW
jgi:hypothetical protein